MLPRTVGPYRVEAMLGEGGMGVVYRAVGPSGERVALKVLRAALRSEALVARFEREARLGIDHPNVVRIVEAGTDAEGTPFMALELLEGESLAERFARGRPAVADVVAWGAQACAGLAAAHARSLVHRDIKPSNLFLCADGTLKIIDFGVALLGDAHTRLTQTGAVPGTVGYLSPEQAAGERTVDARSDLWALGAVLYEALCGTAPFKQATPLATVVATLMADLVPLRVRVPSVPASVASVIERALARNPADRYPTAAAMREALLGADLGASPATSEEPSRPGPSIRPGEQRVVAVLFAEGVRDAGALERTVLAAGGSLFRLIGDRALGVFGAERWIGDEIARAARAALASRDAAARMAVASGWATGTGAGIAGAALEAAERCNTARLSGVALDAEAARSLRDTMPLVRIAEGIFELRGDEPTDEAVRTDAFPLLGRDAEMAQIAAATRSALSDCRALVLLLSGPAGIGKSRLRDAAEREIARRAEARLVSVAASAAHRDADLGLARAIAEAAGLGTGPLEREDPTTRVDVARARDRFRVAFLESSLAAAERAPLVLSIEDLHWADPTSLELLEDLIDAGDRLPISILATARPELFEREPAPFAGREVIAIEPRPLGRADVATLASRVAGRPLRADLAGALADRTGGNPFFVIQSVRALEDEGRLDAEPESLRLPATVEAAVQSRLDHLPEPERDLCRRVSVWGRPFTAAEAGAVGVTAPEPLLASMVSRDLLTKRGRGSAALYRLDGALIEEVAYRSLAPELERALHHAAAAHLRERADADLEERARHHDRAGEEAPAAEDYGAAAHAALRRGDCQSALRCAERALALGVGPSDRFELSALCVDALRFLGRPDALGRALEDAQEAALTDAQRARIASERAVWLWRAGRSDEALSFAERAVEAARASGDRDARILARGRQFLVLAAAGKTREAEDALGEAVCEARDADPMLRATALAWRAHHLATTGDLAARLEAFVELTELYGDLGDVRRAAGARANLADAYNRLGAYAEAAEALEAAIEDCQRVGHRTMEGYARLNLGYALIGVGRVTSALAALDAADAIAQDTGEARLARLVRVYRARAFLATCDHARAAEEADAAASDAESSMPDLHVLALSLAARAHLALGSIDAALDRSARALAGYESLGGLEEDEADVFLARAQALEAAGHTNEGADVRARGKARIEERATAIGDAVLRQRFLQAQRALWA